MTKSYRRHFENRPIGREYLLELPCFRRRTSPFYQRDDVSARYHQKLAAALYRHRPEFQLHRATQNNAYHGNRIRDIS